MEELEATHEQKLEQLEAAHEQQLADEKYALISQMAHKLLQMGMDIPHICQVTGLSAEQLQQMYKKV